VRKPVIVAASHGQVDSRAIVSRSVAIDDSWWTWQPPFFGFATNRMTTACTYDNPNGYTLRSGGSYQTDEQCVAVGYFFPATRPLQCRDGYPL
jgi:hypothetical protein